MLPNTEMRGGPDMTDHQIRRTDPGPRCRCGHPEHLDRCSCGCRSYVAAGSHRDQSRGGAVPAVAALSALAVLIMAIVVVLLLW
jgi:hypothetical protein